MPVKKRIGKHRSLDDYRAQQLVEGPDACLLAGVGYLTRGSWDQMPTAEQEAARADMMADWHRHGAAIMEWWRDGSDSLCDRPWCFVLSRHPDTLPWAAREFGAR